MPGDCIPLYTRLTRPVGEMAEELADIRPEVIIHLAALVPVAECSNNPDLAYSLNVDSACDWMEAAKQANVQRFVFASTSHIYAESEKPIGTNGAVMPRSEYARTKYRAEQELQSLSSAWKIPLVVARIFGVLSPANRPGFLLTNLHDRARRADMSPIAGLSHVRDFLPAEEICRRLFRLATMDNPPSIANICSGTPRYIRSVAMEVFHEYGLDASVIQESPGRHDDTPYLVGVPTPL